MQTCSWARIKELLADAIELPAEDRAALLDDRCGGDAALRSRVEALLAAYTRAGDMLEPERPDARQDLLGADAEPIEFGASIGRYLLVRRIGSGGMGTVYEAEQDQPHRRVALKVIRLGMDTAEVVARFEAEREALALMDHPNIARVFDAGTTQEGRPYFVMELVSGVPLTQFCDDECLSTHQRLELLLRVCDAVQHAHQKAIIHRDLKPSNILVAVHDGRPVPKVIDFGVAKALTKQLADHTLQTEQGQLLGTPEYMSPEQAGGETGIDTRSDIYSLGVVLYELLAGAMPFDAQSLRAGGYAEVRRIIREVEPPRPSTRLSTLGEAGAEVARRRGSQPPVLLRQLRGDLDWITMKAMHKDRDRRYATAADLGADIRRHLTHEPVTAGPPSSVYRIRKFVRRHRRSVGAGLTLVAVLMAGALVSSVLYVRASRSAAESAAAKTFLEGILTAPDPKLGKGRSVAGREVLQEAARSIDPTFAKQPLIAASLKTTLGRAYHNMGLPAEAEAMLREALRLRLSLLGENKPETAESMNRLGDALRAGGKLAEAESLLRRALEVRRRLLGSDHPDVADSCNSLFHLFYYTARYAEAEPLANEGLEIRRRNLGERHQLTLQSMHNLGTLLQVTGRWDEAEPIHRQVLAVRREVLGDDHVDTTMSLWALASILHYRGDLAGAEAAYRDLLEQRRRLLGERHVEVADTMDSLARVLFSRGGFAQAEGLHREALDIRREQFAGDHPRIAGGLHYLGTTCHALGKFAESEDYLRRALEMRERLMGPESLDVAGSLAELGNVLRSMGEYEKAEPLCRRALEIRRDRLRPDHADVIVSMWVLGVVLHGRGDDAGAEAMLRECLAHFEESSVAKGIGASIRTALGKVLADGGRLEEAEPMIAEALAIRRAALGSEHRDTLRSIRGLGRLRRQQGRAAEADQLLSECLADQRRLFGPDDFEVAQTLEELAALRVAEGDSAAAVPLLEETLRIERLLIGPSGRRTMGTAAELVELLAGLNRVVEAEALARESLEAAGGLDGKDTSAIQRLADALAGILQATGRAGEADALRKQAGGPP
jgi:serine/threonine protein kinase